MSFVWRRTWAWAGLAALAIGTGAPGFAQQPASGAAPQGTQPPAGAQQQGRAGGGGGRPQTQPLGLGPWDVTSETGPIHVSVVTKSLQNPWGLQFLPNGDMLVTERPGRLRIVRAGKLDPTPIAGM